MVPSSRTCPAVFAGRCEHRNDAVAGPALTQARCAAQGLSVPRRGRGHAAHDAGAPGPLRVQPGRGRPRRGALGILGPDLAWVLMFQVVWTNAGSSASTRIRARSGTAQHHASVCVRERGVGGGGRERRGQQFAVHSNHSRRCLLSVACFGVQRAVAWIIRGQTRSKTGMVSSGALTILVTPPTTTSLGSKRFFQLAPLGNTTLRFVAPCVVTGATRYFGPSVY